MKRLWEWLKEFHADWVAFRTVRAVNLNKDLENFAADEYTLADNCPDCGVDYLWAPVHDKCYSCGRGIA